MGMNDVTILDVYAALILVLPHTDTNTGTRQTTHLNDICELNIAKGPSESTTALIMVRAFQMVGHS